MVDYIITKRGTQYGCKVATKFIVGVGCILHDSEKRLYMLGNEINKQIRLQQLNAREMPTQMGYFEDFGGKVEYKHVGMHLYDVALTELYEETAMLFNVHFDDIKTCSHIVIDVPNTTDNAYMCIIIPCNLEKFVLIRTSFLDNVTILSTTLSCQKQFYEINDVGFFQYDKITAPSEKKNINGYYGILDTIYKCEDVCNQEKYISSRVMKFFTDGVHKDSECSVWFIPIIHSNGIKTFASTKLVEDAHNISHAINVAKLQKYFVSRIDCVEKKILIGGDIPMMYYNEIKKKTPTRVSHEPRLVIYADNICSNIFDNVYMNYNGDQTNIYLHKWSNEPQSFVTFTNGIFFQLNDRIYFSYFHNSEYKRIFLGIIKQYNPIDVIVYDDLIYKQSLAVDVGQSLIISCMNELQNKTAIEPTIKYFNDNKISQVRSASSAAIFRFNKLKQTVLNTLAVTDIETSILDIKGRYHLFNVIANLCCKRDLKYTVTGITCFECKEVDAKKFFDTMDAKLTSSRPGAKLYRASMPYEFDCEASNTNVGIFDLAKNTTFKYNNIMWASETTNTEYMPDFYISSGLYDCFIITPPADNINAKYILPYYRFNHSAFDRYSVAYECIIPPGTTFKVTKIDYGLISINNVEESPFSDTIKIGSVSKTYWKRIITLEPQNIPYGVPIRGGEAKQTFF